MPLPPSEFSELLTLPFGVGDWVCVRSFSRSGAGEPLTVGMDEVEVEAPVGPSADCHRAGLWCFFLPKRNAICAAAAAGLATACDQTAVVARPRGVEGAAMRSVGVEGRGGIQPGAARRPR